MISYKLNKLIYILLIIGSINWGSVGLTGSTELNLVSIALNNKVLQKIQLERIIYIIVGLAGVYATTMLFNRDYLLPFLGKCVYPCNSLKNKVPANTTEIIEIETEPNVNVIYWASEPENNDKDRTWKQAYGKYMNSGVTKSNNDGKAILKFRKPRSYIVPYKGELKPHVHYRICKNNGMLSRIETVYI